LPIAGAIVNLKLRKIKVNATLEVDKKVWDIGNIEFQELFE